MGDPFWCSIEQIRGTTTKQKWELYIKPRLPAEHMDPQTPEEMYLKIYMMEKLQCGASEEQAVKNATDAVNRWLKARENGESTSTRSGG